MRCYANEYRLTACFVVLHQSTLKCVSWIPQKPWPCFMLYSIMYIKWARSLFQTNAKNTLHSHYQILVVIVVIIRMLATSCVVARPPVLRYYPTTYVKCKTSYGSFKFFITRAQCLNSFLLSPKERHSTANIRYSNING